MKIKKGIHLNVSKFFLVAAVISAFVSFLSIPAFSEQVKEWENSSGISSNKANYFAVKAGMFSPQSSDLDDFDVGFNGEIAYGRYFNQNFATELGIGYFKTEGEDRHGKADVKVYPFTASAKAILPLNDFELYALGGIGLYLTCNDIDWASDSSSEDKYLGYGIHLGAGVNYNIVNNVFVGVEGKYVWTIGDSKKDIDSCLNPKIEGFLVAGNIGYRF